jgi:hypothetical protein
VKSELDGLIREREYPKAFVGSAITARTATVTHIRTSALTTPAGFDVACMDTIEQISV